MEKDENLILTIDISSNSVKVGLVSEQLKIKIYNTQDLKIYNEDLDGFAKRFDMDDLWKKVIIGMNFVLSKFKNNKIIGLSTCTQRIASVFLDEKGNAVYGGPNIDIRGIDSAYLIDDAFSESDLFEITGHTPPLLFCLARLLWFKEEAEEVYAKIKKVLTLDDWLVYKFTGNFYSDLSSAAESQLLDVKKGEWSSEIIDTFNFDPDFFPEIVDSGTIVGELKEDLNKRFDLDHYSIPFVKTGGDTQATLLGMGVIEEGDIGISLGTTAPLHLVVNKPIFDPNYNYWTSCHSIKGKWLIESHAGNTGASYNWFKEGFLSSFTDNPDSLIEDYLKNKMIKAQENGDFREAKKYAQMTSKLDTTMIEESKKLLKYLGIPIVDATSEGEAQSAFLVEKGDAWACASQDYDTLLFGGERLIRNFAVSRSKKLKNTTVTLDIEYIPLSKFLENLNITREQLIEMGILIGTDFYPGIKGIGQHKALELIRKFGSLDNIINNKVKIGKIEIHIERSTIKQIKEIFLYPDIKKDYPKIIWEKSKYEKVEELLIEQHNFSKQRVENAIERLKKQTSSKTQVSLDSFFNKN